MDLPQKYHQFALRFQHFRWWSVVICSISLCGIVAVALFGDEHFLWSISMMFLTLVMAQSFFVGGFLFEFRQPGSSKAVLSHWYVILRVREWIGVCIFSVMLPTPILMFGYVIIASGK